MFTKIECGECGGPFVRECGAPADYAKCDDCGHEVSVTVDIRPNLEDGEVVAWTPDAVTLRAILVTYTEEVA